MCLYYSGASSFTVGEYPLRYSDYSPGLRPVSTGRITVMFGTIPYGQRTKTRAVEWAADTTFVRIETVVGGATGQSARPLPDPGLLQIARALRPVQGPDKQGASGATAGAR